MCLRFLPQIIGSPQYRFALPDLPSQPLLLQMPYSKDSVIKMEQTTFERQVKYPLLTEPDLGIPVDLVTYIGHESFFFTICYSYLDSNSE